MTEQQNTSARNTGARTKWPLIVTAVVGGVVLISVIGVAAFVGAHPFMSSSQETQQISANVNEVDELEVNAGSADFSVEFSGQGGADEALLEVSGGIRQWQMNLDDDGTTLVVDSRRQFGIDWFSFGPRPAQRVVLHLPESLRTQGLDADLKLSSGSLLIVADFGELDVKVSSGSATIGGSARSFDAHLSSGRLLFELADVAEVDLGVSSGRMSGELTGSAPSETEVSVNSGSVELVLPDVPYAVSSRVSSGRFDNLLRTDPASRNTVEASLSSGKINLRAES